MTRMIETTLHKAFLKYLNVKLYNYIFLKISQYETTYYLW